jgi:ABC-2 type transport system permease protein
VPAMTTDAAARPPHEPRGVLHDTWVIARRGLVHMRRQPEVLSDATIQPIVFVLLFSYVVGGAIDMPAGGSYREFLMGGIFAQTIVFTAFGVAQSLAHDRRNQVVDRFRSLPIAKGAVLGGHAVAELFKALLPIAIMSICGLAIGWRIRDGALDAVAGYALLLAFAFAMIWVGVLLGSVVRTPEGVQGIAVGVLFPLTFLASTFVPVETMPAALHRGRRVEPGHHPRRRATRAVREPEHLARGGRRLVGHPPCRLHPHLDRRDRRRLRTPGGPRLPTLDPEVRRRERMWDMRSLT